MAGGQKIRHEVILMFNKVSKKFAGGIDASTLKGNVTKLSDKFFIYKRVQLDPETETWKGDYDNGSIIDNAEFQKMYMDDYIIDAMCAKKINKCFPSYKQINIFSGVLLELMEHVGMDKIPKEERSDALYKFYDMLSYIGHIRENNERYKQAYKDSPYHDYQTKEQVNADLDAELEAGLRDILPKPSELVADHPMNTGSIKQ